jgi:hypothetical protein
MVFPCCLEKKTGLNGWRTQADRGTPPSSSHLAAHLGYRLLGRHVCLVGSLPSADWRGVTTIPVAVTWRALQPRSFMTGVSVDFLDHGLLGPFTERDNGLSLRRNGITRETRQKGNVTVFNRRSLCT